jgi:hypothetical protein
MSRFVVTSLRHAAYDARTLYEELYCARSEAESRHRRAFELCADYASRATMAANQLRSVVFGNRLRPGQCNGPRDTESDAVVATTASRPPALHLASAPCGMNIVNYFTAPKTLRTGATRSRTSEPHVSDDIAFVYLGQPSLSFARPEFQSCSTRQRMGMSPRRYRPVHAG